MDAPTLAAAHERLAQARDLLEQMEGDNEQLRAEVKDLKRELAARPPIEFVEHRGALWKRLTDGSFARDAYCPKHRTALSSQGGHTMCTLDKCGFEAPFFAREIATVHASIPKDS